MGKKLNDLDNSNVTDLKIIKKEKPASSHINITSHLDEYTLIDKNSQLIRIFKIKGINATKLDDEARAIEKEMRNRFYKESNGDIAMYFWSIRCKKTAVLHGEFIHGTFADEFNNDYQKVLDNKEFYTNDYYMALVTKPANGITAKSIFVMKKLFIKANENAYQKYIDKQQKIINDFSSNLLDRFSKYEIRSLGIKEINGRVVSEPLSFLGFLLNHSNFNMPQLSVGSDRILMRARPFFNRRTGVISLVDINSQTKFAAVLSIKLYCCETLSGMLDGIQELPIEQVITHSFSPYYKDVAKRKLQSAQREMLQSKDSSVIETSELSDSMEDIARSENAYGIHHMTVLVFADSTDELNASITSIKQCSDNVGLVLTKEDIGSEIAFWAQLPGNFSYIARGAAINTKNLASFISFHAPAKGQQFDNHWGDALTILSTVYDTPYYFNIHSRDVGIGLIYGIQGSGKTVLAASLMLQSMKFGGKRILFDKDNGLKIMVLAAGGNYFSLELNKPSNLNPLKLSDTSSSRAFLSDLLGKMLSIYGNQLDEADNTLIKNVVDNLFALLPFNQRQMCHIAPFFGTSGLNNLRNKFDEWHSNGRFAWVFDNENDNLNLDSEMVGFDITQLIKAQDIKTPVFMYLLHRAKQALHGIRGGIFVDEGFAVFDAPYFCKTLIEDGARTNRKKNHFLIIATQQPEDTVNTTISSALNEVASFKIFYPNPTAKNDIYCKHLGLTAHELEIVKKLDSNSRYFLLQFARGSEVEVVRMNLKDMKSTLKIISGREQSVKILDGLLANNPDMTPSQWLPLFLEKCEGGVDGQS